MNQYNKGSAEADLIWVIGLMITLFIIWVFTGGPDRSISASPFVSAPSVISSSGGSTRDSGEAVTISTTSGGDIIKIDDRVYIKSPYYDLISIGKGSAQREYQTRSEYITLTANRRLKEPVNITGWKLENGDKYKTFELDGTIKKGVSNFAFIPQGIKIFKADTSKPILSPIILNPGDRAVVTTGSFPDIGDIEINYSFQTNICTGYIEDLKRYDFEPSLDYNCPDPEDELGIDSVSDSCFEFIEDIDECHTPDFEPFRSGGDLVRNHVDGNTSLSNSCHQFIKDHYSYESCVENHLTDENFLQPEWRIFLRQGWQMWGDQRDIISLFDSNGRLVDQLEY